MGHILRHNRDLGAGILGARATLHAYDADGRDALADAPGGSAAHAITAQVARLRRRSRSTAAPIRSNATSSANARSASRRSPATSPVLPFNELPKNG